MTIALSTVDGQRLGHLGETRQFALTDVDPSRQTIIRSGVIAAPSHAPGSFPGWLREHNVKVLITAGIGPRALDNLDYHGIETRIGPPGALAESLAADWLAGRFTLRDNGCDQRVGAPAGHACRLSSDLERQRSWRPFI